jgi:hypothetical protein
MPFRIRMQKVQVILHFLHNWPHLLGWTGGYRLGTFESHFDLLPAAISVVLPSAHRTTRTRAQAPFGATLIREESGA